MRKKTKRASRLIMQSRIGKHKGKVQSPSFMLKQNPEGDKPRVIGNRAKRRQMAADHRRGRQ